MHRNTELKLISQNIHRYYVYIYIEEEYGSGDDFVYKEHEGYYDYGFSG